MPRTPGVPMLKLLKMALVAGSFLLPASDVFSLGAGLTTAARAEQSPSDQATANAALRSLHDLARAIVNYQQAAKENDQLGCHEAYLSIQKLAHAALTEMHSMSAQPIDAVEDVSSLLRVGALARNDCSFDPDTRSLLLIGGQAISALRYDYAIGEGDWFTISEGAPISSKNPLRYSQSLRDQSYSWVSVRPKDMLVIAPSDWKAEMASRDVDDSTIENSGANLKAVEVAFRQRPEDTNTTVYFYRNKDDARSAMDARNALVEADAKAEADLKASKAEWGKKLASLPYLIPDHKSGFKLVYGVCRDTGKRNADGSRICTEDGSRDWSDDRREPYHWFSDFHSCGDAQQRLIGDVPLDLKINSDDAFVSSCVPAPKVNRHSPKGYVIMFTLIAPGAMEDDALYATLSELNSKSATVFTKFSSCDEAIEPAHAMALTDLGADKNGSLLSDRTISIGLWATCVRIY
jgi:hypothetical protein